MTAPTCTHLLANKSSADATSWTTASVTVTSGKPVLLFVHSSKGSGTPTTPTLTAVPSGVTVDSGSGTGNWTRFAGLYRTTLFWLTGGGADVVTIDFGGVTQTGCHWHFNEVNDTNDTLPTHVVNGTGTGTGASVDFTSLTAGNSGFAGCGAGDNGTQVAEISPAWTQLGTVQVTTLPASSSSTQYRAADDDTTAGVTLSPASDWNMIGVELEAASTTITSTLAVTVANDTSAASGRSRAKAGWGIVQ